MAERAGPGASAAGVGATQGREGSRQITDPDTIGPTLPLGPQGIGRQNAGSGVPATQTTAGGGQGQQQTGGGGGGGGGGGEAPAPPPAPSLEDLLTGAAQYPQLAGGLGLSFPGTNYPGYQEVNPERLYQQWMGQQQGALEKLMGDQDLMRLHSIRSAGILAQQQPDLFQMLQTWTPEQMTQMADASIKQLKASAQSTTGTGGAGTGGHPWAQQFAASLPGVGGGAMPQQVGFAPQFPGVGGSGPPPPAGFGTNWASQLAALQPVPQQAGAPPPPANQQALQGFGSLLAGPVPTPNTLFQAA